MLQDCRYNPASDIEETVPGLSVDIAEVMATHQVMSTGDSSPYSKETEVKEVGHYITDKIQAAVVAMNLNKSISAAKASTSQTPAASAASE